MSDKILITSGCSFTADEPTWAHYLAKQLDAEHHNMAMSGAGNHVISSEVIRKVEKLLNSGINPDKLIVGVQWSGVFRFDMVIDNQLDTAIERPVHLANGQKSRAWPAPANTENTWVMTAGSTHKGFWPSYYLLMSKEQAFTQTLENILRTQWYLKSKNIKYFMFTGWDILTEGAVQKLYNDVMTKPNQFTDEIYDSSDHQLISTNCKWFGHLFEMIDFDCFWTHNSPTTKMGGMIQWLRETQPADSVFRSSRDFHPSSKSHEVFASDVLMEFINV